MNKLWLGFAAIVVYGSIFPFDFEFHPIPPFIWREFIASCCVETSRGDILGNVILFLPFGFLGILSVAPQTRLGNQFLLVCAIGLVFAVFLQALQLYLPSRHENLQDALWNLLGVGIGGLLGIPAQQYLRRATGQGAELHLVPWILIGSWLTFRLLPFIPSFDPESIEDALRPLLEFQEFSLIGAAYHSVAWLVIGRLMDIGLGSKGLGRWLPLVVLATFGAEIAIVYNIVTPTTVFGGLLGVLLFWMLRNRMARTEVPLFAALLVVIALNHLEPFVIRAQPIAFNWLPFQGFFGGSMFVNAQSSSEKVFAYGSLVFLLLRIGTGGWLSLAATASCIAAIEFAQTYVIRHTPEITDPLLIVFAAIAIFAIDSLDPTPSFRRDRFWAAGARFRLGSSDPLSRSHSDSNGINRRMQAACVPQNPNNTQS